MIDQTPVPGEWWEIIDQSSKRLHRVRVKTVEGNRIVWGFGSNRFTAPIRWFTDHYRREPPPKPKPFKPAPPSSLPALDRIADAVLAHQRPVRRRKAHDGATPPRSSTSDGGGSASKTPTSSSSGPSSSSNPPAASTTPPEPSLKAPPREKNPDAVALGKLGGAKGGHARAAKLSRARLSAIGRNAAAARWASTNGAP